MDLLFETTSLQYFNDFKQFKRVLSVHILRKPTVFMTKKQ